MNDLPEITKPTPLEVLSDEQLATLLMHRGAAVDGATGDRCMESILSGDPELMAAACIELVALLGFAAHVDVDNGAVALSDVSPARLVEHLEANMPDGMDLASMTKLIDNPEPLQIVRGLRLGLRALRVDVVALPVAADDPLDSSSADTVPIGTDGVH